MQFQYIPYIWPLIGSACMTLFLGIYELLVQKKAKGITYFVLSMFVVTIWSSCNALEMSSLDFSTKLFWANMQYFAYCYSPVTLLALCMQFTGYDKWVNNKRILWLAVIPTIIIVLIWTDGLHGLIRYNMSMDYSGLFPVITKKYGPAFYIHAVYSHTLNMIACVLLIKRLFIKNMLYRRQALALLVGMSLIIVPNIIYISGISAVKRFDITPVFFGPAALIMSWGIFRFKMFDLVPLARTTVIETMNAGMMVLDLQERILDVNTAFEKILGKEASKIYTRKVGEVCSNIPEFARACMDGSVAHAEFSIEDNEIQKVYEVMLSPLTDKNGILIGRLAMIYEITEKKQAEQEFLKQQRKLAVVKERERITRDMHDNLGQVLGFINLQAQGIRQELVNSGVEIAVGSIDKLIEVTQSAHNEIREYIRNMRNLNSMEKNLFIAIEKYITDFKRQTAISVEHNIPMGFDGEGFEINVMVNLLNIVKEALNNIRKHAQATQVKIYYHLHGGHLSITIEDNGKGFEADDSPNSTGNKFGLNIMRERAAEIGAEIHLESVVGKGSKVTLRIPVRKGESENEADAG